MDLKDINLYAWKGTIRILTASPLHVGNGQVLRSGLDYYYSAEHHKVVRLDIEKYAQNLADTGRMFRTPPIVIKPGNRAFDEFPPAYTLTPASGFLRATEMREAIRLPGYKPYIPGSALKGALRTFLLWMLAKYENNPDITKKALQYAQSNKLSAVKAQGFEGAYFRGEKLTGKKGNIVADNFKALTVRDSSPIPYELEQRAFQVGVHHGPRFDWKKDRGNLMLQAFEAIPPNCEITVDVHVTKDQLRHEGDYNPSNTVSNLLRNVSDLKELAYFYGKDISKIERQYYKKAGLDSLVAFFSQDDLFPLGFGTGWNTKTIGALIDQQDLIKAGVPKRNFMPPPISRKVALDEQGNPTLPLGWVKLKWGQSTR